MQERELGVALCSEADSNVGDQKKELGGKGRKKKGGRERV